MYTADWRLGEGLIEGDFAVEMKASSEVSLFRYPTDPYLPGLSAVATPSRAHDLLAHYVGIRPHRVHVSAVRYRATRRAVLRHKVSWGHGARASFYVRVMPPSRLERFLEIGNAASLSGFVLPRLAGHWSDGGVAWLSEVPGVTARAQIRRGKGIAPGLLLDALEPLWAGPFANQTMRPLNVAADFGHTLGVLDRVLDNGPGRDLLGAVRGPIEEFVTGWAPSALAHNDFYDNQIIVTPDGRPAIVDFEEVGPGDPMIDVGNMLAHLRWQAHFQITGPAAEALAGYRRQMRALALSRYGWDEEALDMREAYSLFRLSSNPARHQRDNWHESVAQALALTKDALEGRDAVTGPDAPI
jgi:hypothetical protein